MQFSINKDVFLDGINKVQGIAGRKTTFPITSNVLITASGSAISIVATDLEIGFKGFYPAAVQNEGSITIPGKKLFEIVREFPHGSLECKELENGWIEIAKDKVQYHMVGMDPEDFPKLPEVADVEFITMQAHDIIEMIEKVNLPGGLSSEEKRPHLIGVYFEIINLDGVTTLRMVSTDGNRLARVDYITDPDTKILPFGQDKGVILPKKVMGEIIRLAEGKGQIELGIKGNYFVVKKENETIIGRLVEGEYPDYTMVIPKGIETFFEVEKVPFISILKRMSILCSERYRAVRFKVEKELFEVSVKNPELGDSKDEFPIIFNGEPFTASFNPGFFIDAVNPMKSGIIKIIIENEEKPCLIKGEKDPNYISVIMPMRT